MTGNETRIPCPFVYSNGKRCEGHVVNWRVYGPGYQYRPVPFHKARKVRLWCSLKHDHAGILSSFEAKERMEFYPDQLPDELIELIWPE